MSPMKAALCEGLPQLGLTLPEQAVEGLCAFGEGVIRQNEVMNLTAITEPDQVARLHLLDSLTVLTVAELKNKTLVDVGCGAGFPGVPLKLACPELKLTLLDSLGKRMRWLEEFLPTLGITARYITGRAEEAVTAHREQFDYATSRAVARLNILLELTAPYVKVGGAVIALKGAAAAAELAEAKNAIRQLGLQLENQKTYALEGTAHTVLVLRKVRPTPARYPRRYAQIKKTPL